MDQSVGKGDENVRCWLDLSQDLSLAGMKRCFQYGIHEDSGMGAAHLGSFFFDFLVGVPLLKFYLSNHMVHNYFASAEPSYDKHEFYLEVLIHRLHVSCDQNKVDIAALGGYPACHL